ncbi:MAG: pilus assembly protein [Acidobacteria bacterium]|jgi:type IV pilus assembly protein PilQ|nr:MAG: pilus assembly protein [Acidobacteriota bacterium]
MKSLLLIALFNIFLALLAYSQESAFRSLEGGVGHIVVEKENRTKKYIITEDPLTRTVKAVKVDERGLTALSEKGQIRAARQDRIVEMKFENVKLETVLRGLSEVSGMNVMFDSIISTDLQKPVNISIYKPVPLGEAFNIVIKSYGLIAVPVDTKVYKITKAGETVFNIGGYTEEEVQKLIELLKARVSPSAEIVIDKTLRKVYVRDEASNIERIRQLSKDIGIAVVAEKEALLTKVFYIRRDISYNHIAKAIRELGIEGLTLTESPEFNALIVSAKERDLQRIEKAIEKYLSKAAGEKPILTKVLYVRYVPADEFKKLIQPMLSEVGEVYVLGAGITTTATEERELRDIQQRLQELVGRLREAAPEERSAIQQQVQALQQRQQELQRIIQAPAAQRGDSVSVSRFPQVREGILGPEFQKEKSARVVFQNALIVRDYADNVYRILERYKDLVSEQPIQIKIEARVVEVSSSAIRELGINWNALLSQARVPQFWSGGGGSNLGLGTPPAPGTLFGVPSYLAPGLSPTPGGILALTFQRGILNALNLRLSAYEQVGKAKSLAKPVVVTLNGEPATIQSVLEFPIRRVTVVPGGTTTITVDFKLIPINLTVTPILLPEGNMMLDITLSKSEITRLERFIAETAEFDIPTVQSQRADTKLIVKDGDLVVLGGLIKSTERNDERGIPGLMRVPFFRWLFMEQRTEKEDSELLIFIMPTLVTQ